MSKKIILIWKFSKEYCVLPERFKKTGWENENNIDYISSISVKNTNNSICPIILEKNEVTKDTFENTLKLAKNILDEENRKKNDTLILLHNTEIGGQKILDNCLNEELSKKIRETLGNDNYEIFKGGSGGVIYHLIADEASFRKDVFENGEIKKEVFDAIWNEYNVKKKIIRLKFDFLSKYLPIVIDMRGLKECAKRKDDAENYLGEIKKEDWALFSKDSLNKYDWPSAELRKEIETPINQIVFLGKIIEKSKVSQDVINEMKNKQFNIDDWYSELGDCFERYI